MNLFVEVSPELVTDPMYISAVPDPGHLRHLPTPKFYICLILVI